MTLILPSAFLTRPLLSASKFVSILQSAPRKSRLRKSPCLAWSWFCLANFGLNTHMCSLWSLWSLWPLFTLRALEGTSRRDLSQVGQCTSEVGTPPGALFAHRKTDSWERRTSARETGRGPGLPLCLVRHLTHTSYKPTHLMAMCCRLAACGTQN